MMIDLIDAVLFDEGTVMATIDKTDDEGVVFRLAHMIPRDTLEWRAAEYGIDPKDTDTLLDIILYEPHISIDPDKHLYAAKSVKEARDHLLEKVSARKAEAAPGRARVKGGTRERLLSLFDMDSEVIRVKAEMVGLHRERLQAQSRPAPVDRTSGYKRMLKEMKDARANTDGSSRPGQA